MGNFLSNALADLVGTFVGAGLALLSAWWLDRRRTRSRERRMLRGLVEDLYRRRALTPDPGIGDGGGEEHRERCAISVLAARDRITSLRDDLARHEEAVAILDGMYEHCAQYLGATEQRPERYIAALIALRGKLTADIEALRRAFPSLALRDPETVWASAS